MALVLVSQSEEEAPSWVYLGNMQVRVASLLLSHGPQESRAIKSYLRCQSTQANNILSVMVRRGYLTVSKDGVYNVDKHLKSMLNPKGRRELDTQTWHASQYSFKQER